MKKIYELKVNLKQLAVQIQTTKKAFKESQRTGEYSPGSHWDFRALRREIRHKHIAYCQLRGRTREQIERPGEGNRPDEKLILEYMTKYFDEPVEKSL